VSSALGALGRFDEAEVLAREALAMRRQIFGNEHPEVAGPNGSLGYMAEALRNQQKLGEAEIILRELLATRRKLYGSEPLYVTWSLSDLADVLRQGGKLDEAESLYREALALQRKLSGDTHPSVAESCYNLATVLNAQGKRDEAERVFNDILTSELETQPQAAILLRVRANFRARAGRWKEAATDFWKVIEFEPDNHVDYHLLASLLVKNDDLDAYHRLRGQIVERFGATADPVIAERMAKDCLILPASGAELKTLARMADTAIAAAPDHWGATFFQFAKGLSEYRQGRFDRAAEWMEKVLAKSGEFDFRDSQAYMVLAMARHRLNHADQARAALVKGNEIAKLRLKQLETDDPGDYWWDWVIVQSFEREARNLIERPLRATPDSPNKP
jgi:tetratricopeptide (TPR) repeat protein